VNQKYLFICDSQNHRVQIIFKGNGLYQFQWGNTSKSGTMIGEFENPYSMSYDGNECERLYYVGDYYSVQIFEENGKCVQRIGEGKWGKKNESF